MITIFVCAIVCFFLGTGCMGPFSDVCPHVVSVLFLACIRLPFSVNWTSSLGVPQRIASSSASLSEARACSGSMMPNSAAGPVLSMIAYALRFSLSILITFAISSVIYVLLSVLVTLS